MIRLTYRRVRYALHVLLCSAEPCADCAFLRRRAGRRWS